MGKTNFKHIKVLVVEDDIANSDLMKAYLDYLGCEYDCASDGQEAVEKVKSGTFDICFMDLQMRIMGGIEATKTIRKEINKDLPIIALTASITDGFKDRCFETGMNNFVKKPVSIEDIKTQIARHVKNHKK